CDVNVGTFSGYSPLHAACHAGHLRIVRFLIDEGVELEKVDKNGHTPMMLAAGHGSVIRVSTEGEQADEALKALGELIARDFEEVASAS
ncbi:MAG: ankyrin repeat domain-containing protein, partial [Akkermansiaceae bacterium]